MNEHERRIQDEALQYARQHRARIARNLVDLSIYPREEYPLAVFMAGSPGAGKTEVSKAFVAAVTAAMPSLSEGGSQVLRIDPDEFRILFPGYEGSNSWLFQPAVIKVLEKVLDRAFSKSISFLLDGTLSSMEVARTNVRRALNKNCTVQILYVYQQPGRAWRFVQDREVVEGRNIPLDAFVAQFFAARRNVKALKQAFGDQIMVDLLVQAESGEGYGQVEVDVSAELIDELLPKTYDEATLYEMLSSGGGYDEQN